MNNIARKFAIAGGWLAAFTTSAMIAVALSITAFADLPTCAPGVASTPAAECAPPAPAGGVGAGDNGTTTGGSETPPQPPTQAPPTNPTPPPNPTPPAGSDNTGGGGSTTPPPTTGGDSGPGPTTGGGDSTTTTTTGGDTTTTGGDGDNGNGNGTTTTTTGGGGTTTTSGGDTSTTTTATTHTGTTTHTGNKHRKPATRPARPANPAQAAAAEAAANRASQAAFVDARTFRDSWKPTGRLPEAPQLSHEITTSVAAAATAAGINWQLLTTIAWTDSRWGDPSAGAFTGQGLSGADWKTYGTDGDGDGKSTRASTADQLATIAAP
ncbi:MAG: hypothetical protein H7123_09255, partial [Thermoleophilia bacterium]|nr:hypothetical protein [Thermoleophilia bacterium]